MKTNRLFYTYIAALLLMFGAAACSSATEENREYGDVDINGDAVLDDSEFAVAWDEMGYYNRWDANHDGYLDDEEWADAGNRFLGEERGALADWDTDADQRLSEDEFRTGIYNLYDRDRDRMINEEEYNAWYRAGE